VESCACQLCEDIASGETVVYSSERFSVIPSLGALAPGHVLVVPNEHALRMADVPKREEYLHFQNQVVRRLERLFEAPVHRFEHGSDAAGVHTPCTVSHAHLHLLPAAVDIRDRLEQDYDWKPYRPDDVADGQYLMYQSPDGRVQVAEAAEFPSQYLRQVFAEVLGIEEWNWRTDARWEVVRETAQRFDTGKIQA
jgi:diadenosine tetraphosphate (Ap4A) HIT family hydrolase